MFTTAIIPLAAAAVAGLLAAVVLFYTLELRRQRDLARWQAEKAERVSSLLVDMLEISDPERTRGETVTVRELLGRAADRLHAQFNWRSDPAQQLAQTRLAQQPR